MGSRNGLTTRPVLGNRTLVQEPPLTHSHSPSHSKANSKAKANPKVIQLNTLISSVNQVSNALQTYFVSRAEAIAGGPDLLDPRRNVSAECGWPRNPDISTYSELYEREGLARRVVDVYPDECWTVAPDLYETDKEVETPFEKEFLDLEFEHNIWYNLEQLDTLSGIGRYGALFMGFDDSGDLERPVSGVTKTLDPRRNKKEVGLRYLVPFDETCLSVQKLEENSLSPRRGRPLYYLVTVPGADVGWDAPHQGHVLGGAGVTPGEQVRVHWTRMHHACDSPRSNQVFGTPRLKPVLNRIADLRKVLGGSAEMYWQGAMPGFALEQFPEVALDSDEIDMESVKAQLTNYINRVQRWIAVEGMTVKPLAPQVADPSKHCAEQLKAVCASIKVPMRVFLGSESGKAASDQESVLWNRRLKKRQYKYLDGVLIRGFLRHLILVGALRPPATNKFYTDWTDLNAVTDKDRADIAMKKAQALLEYVSGGVENVFPLREFLTVVMGLSLKQSEAVVQAVKANKDSLTKDVWKKPEPAPGFGAGGGGQRGPAPSPQRATKRPPRNAQGRGRKF